MITTPSMGLKRWDQPNDVFSYTELSDNFALIDSHDHTTGKGVQIPTAGIANLAVIDTKIANDAVTTSKILSANVTDAKLASPTTGMYKELKSGAGTWSGSLTANQLVSLGNGPSLSVSPYSYYYAFYFDPADYAVASKTLKIRLRAWVGNATFTGGGTWAAFLIAATGGISAAGNITTVGASAASANLVAAGTVNTSGDVTPPAAGYYFFGVQNSIAGAGIFSVGVQLQYRHV